MSLFIARLEYFALTWKQYLSENSAMERRSVSSIASLGLRIEKKLKTSFQFQVNLSGSQVSVVSKSPQRLNTKLIFRTVCHFESQCDWRLVLSFIRTSSLKCMRQGIEEMHSKLNWRWRRSMCLRSSITRVFFGQTFFTVIEKTWCCLYDVSSFLMTMQSSFFLTASSILESFLFLCVWLSLDFDVFALYSSFLEDKKMLFFHQHLLESWESSWVKGRHSSLFLLFPSFIYASCLQWFYFFFFYSVSYSISKRIVMIVIRVKRLLKWRRCPYVSVISVMPVFQERSHTWNDQTVLSEQRRLSFKSKRTRKESLQEIKAEVNETISRLSFGYILPLQ